MNCLKMGVELTVRYTLGNGHCQTEYFCTSFKWIRLDALLCLKTEAEPVLETLLLVRKHLDSGQYAGY
jgi:hypothetical protein